MSATCLECKKAATPGFFSSIISHIGLAVTPQFTASCSMCRKQGFCSACLDFAIIQNAAPPFNVQGSVCFSCFKAGTQCFDWSKNEDVYGAENDQGRDNTALPVAAAAAAHAETTTTTELQRPQRTQKQLVICLHGGGGSRRMFSTLAETLAATGRFLVVAPDLPGHGTRVRVKLTMDSAVECVIAATKKFSGHAALSSSSIASTSPSSAGLKPILMGGSFGAYVAADVLARTPNDYAAFVSVVAGQSVSVGDGGGYAARTALVVGRYLMVPLCNTAIMTSLLLKQIAWEKMNIAQIHKECVQPSFYFQQSDETMEVLQNTNSKKGFAAFVGPTLLLLGEKDHRDMADELLRISKANFAKTVKQRTESSSNPASASSLAALEPRCIVYKNTDHFFMTTKQHGGQFIKDVVDFCQKVNEAGF